MSVCLSPSLPHLNFFLVIQEKLEEKRALQEKYIALAAELSQLKERHSQLTMSLKNQTMQREELLSTQQSTEMKIKQILEFVNGIKAAEKEPSQN